MDLGWLPMAVLWSVAALIFWLRDRNDGALFCAVIGILGWILVVWG